MGKTVLTTGVFDCGMHVGHFVLLMKCLDLTGEDGKLIVGINSDESANGYKRKPVFDIHERVSCLQALTFVNEIVVLNSEEDIEKIIKDYDVDYYVKGEEWAGKRVTGERDCKVIFTQNTKDANLEKISTSQIIKRIKAYNEPVTPNQESVLEAASKDKLI